MKIPPADLSSSHPQADAARAERSPDVSRSGREKGAYQSTQYEGRSAGRWWLLLGSLVYSVFVVYGSLVPLRFQAVPFDQALENFRSIRYLQLGIASRADWVANILLFIPLGFLWTGVVWPQRHLFWRTVVSVMVLLAACGLSLSIEFIQQYFPQRTVSLNDIIAETAGATIGIAAWWALGRPMLNWLQALPLVRGTASTAQRLLVFYLVVLFGYNLMPLDLTISPVELFHKWREGKVILLPFSTTYADSAQRAYDLVTDIAIWAPVAVLWQLAYQKARLRTWQLVVAAAAAIEFLQLFVYSRVSDSSDVITAALGAAIGLALERSLWSTNPQGSVKAPMGILYWALASAGWLVVLAAVFWYPFDLNLDSTFLRERLAGLQRVPFEAYYFGTEFRAITEVLRKALFMAPLGFFCYRMGRLLPPSWPRKLVHGGLLFLIAAVAASIETVQIALPSKNADFTDGVLEFLGGALGYACSLFVAERLNPQDTLRQQEALRTAAHPNASSTQDIGSYRTTEKTMFSLRSVGWQVFAVLLAMTLGLRLLLELPGIPYNVVELFDGQRLLSVGLFSVALLWLGAGPWCLAKWAGHRQMACLWLPTLLPLAALFSLLLLRMSVTQESLDDITGSTDLYRRVTMDNYWGEAWRDAMARLPATMVDAVERGVRFTALYSLLLAPLTMASICTDRSWLMRRRLPALALLLLFWWLAAWLVIDGAITDNLTELIARDGSIWLAALAALFSLHVSWASGRMSTRRGMTLGVVTLVALPLSWWLSKQGLEQTILKYDSVWSAQQFLLGHNRIDRLSEAQLFMRWSGVYIAMLGVCALGMALARRLWTASAATTASAPAIPHSPARRR
ncbi:MAG: VanZ family protein [Burkholderiales bacterium PBB1]|nr:MAG: VanZ family protein [Burkholderiales bacterium PBB1]